MTILLVSLIIILFFILWNYETFTEPKYIKLYEGFGQQKLAFTTNCKKLKQVIKINLKSADIDLSQNGIRKVEIWSIYGGENTASLESDFYNTYLEPDYALRANPGKFKKILVVKAGEHVKVDILVPVKKILLKIE